MKLSYLSFSAFLLSGCATTATLAGDPVEFFPVAPDAPQVWAAAGVDVNVPSGNWLAQFEDPQMEALVGEALEANPSIEATAATVRASRAALRSTDARRGPSLTGSGSAGGTSNSAEIVTTTPTVDPNTGLPGDPIVSRNRERFNDSSFGLGLDASWEVDLWGRLDAGVSAAEQDLAASEADYEAARLSVAAQTAIAWVSLNEALAQERVAIETFNARERTKMLTERRFERGLAAALDVRLARSALAGAEAAIAARKQQSGNSTRSLEILLGRYPGAELEAPAEIPSLAPLEVSGNPVMLLSRRPDVAAAEARIKSAGLRAEQARLAMLPSFRLTASLSNSETDIADVFDPARIAARAIGSLTQPLFDGGARAAERDAAIAQAEASVARYASTVLTAWREVEDAIAADFLLAQQEDAQRRSLEEANYAEDLAERQYSNGLVSIFNLIDAQTRRLTAESNLVSARANRAINRIRFHQALGGGLTDPNLPNAVIAGRSSNP